MIKLETDLGDLFIRSGEILAIMPEKNRAGCSLIYCALFTDGISINKTPIEVLELIASAEYEIEYEYEDEDE